MDVHSLGYYDSNYAFHFYSQVNIPVKQSFYYTSCIDLDYAT